jgi:pyruvate-formate lyase-activating enzyme
MTRTRRFYNDRNRCGGGAYRGRLYHPYRQGCMGRCPHCRDPEHEPWILRRRRAEEFRREMREAMAPPEDA